MCSPSDEHTSSSSFSSFSRCASPPSPWTARDHFPLTPSSITSFPLHQRSLQRGSEEKSLQDSQEKAAPVGISEEETDRSLGSGAVRLTFSLPTSPSEALAVIAFPFAGATPLFLSRILPSSALPPSSLPNRPRALATSHSRRRRRSSSLDFYSSRSAKDDKDLPSPKRIPPPERYALSSSSSLLDTCLDPGAASVLPSTNVETGSHTVETVSFSLLSRLSSCSLSRDLLSSGAVSFRASSVLSSLPLTPTITGTGRCSSSHRNSLPSFQLHSRCGTTPAPTPSRFVTDNTKAVSGTNSCSLEPRLSPLGKVRVPESPVTSSFSPFPSSALDSQSATEMPHSGSHRRGSSGSSPSDPPVTTAMATTPPRAEYDHLQHRPMTHDGSCSSTRTPPTMTTSMTSAHHETLTQESSVAPSTSPLRRPPLPFPSAPPFYPSFSSAGSSGGLPGMGPTGGPPSGATAAPPPSRILLSFLTQEQGSYSPLPTSSTASPSSIAGYTPPYSYPPSTGMPTPHSVTATKLPHGSLFPSTAPLRTTPPPPPPPSQSGGRSPSSRTTMTASATLPVRSSSMGEGGRGFRMSTSETGRDRRGGGVGIPVGTRWGPPACTISDASIPHMLSTADVERSGGGEVEGGLCDERHQSGTRHRPTSSRSVGDRDHEGEAFTKKEESGDGMASATADSGEERRPTGSRRVRYEAGTPPPPPPSPPLISSAAFSSASFFPSSQSTSPPLPASTKGVSERNHTGDPWMGSDRPFHKGSFPGGTVRRITVGMALDIVAGQCQRRGLLHASQWLSELSVHATGEVLSSGITDLSTPSTMLASNPFSSSLEYHHEDGLPSYPVGHDSQGGGQRRFKKEMESGCLSPADGLPDPILNSQPHPVPSSSVPLRSCAPRHPWPLQTFVLDDMLLQGEYRCLPFHSFLASSACSPVSFIPCSEGDVGGKGGMHRATCDATSRRSGEMGEMCVESVFSRYHRLSLNLLHQQEYSRCHHLLMNLWKKVKSSSFSSTNQVQQGSHPSLSASLVEFPSCLQFICLYALYMDGEKIRMTNRTRCRVLPMPGAAGGGGLTEQGNPSSTPARKGFSGSGSSSEPVTATFLAAGGPSGTGGVPTGTGQLNPHLRELRMLLHVALSVQGSRQGSEEEEEHHANERKWEGANDHTPQAIGKRGGDRDTHDSQHRTRNTHRNSRSSSPPVWSPWLSSNGNHGSGAPRYSYSSLSSLDIASSTHHRPDPYLLWLMGVVLRGLHAPAQEYTSFFMASITVNPLFFSAWEDLKQCIRTEADIMAAQFQLGFLRPSFMLDIFVATTRTALGMIPVSSALSFSSQKTGKAAFTPRQKGYTDGDPNGEKEEGVERRRRGEEVEEEKGKEGGARQQQLNPPSFSSSFASSSPSRVPTQNIWEMLLMQFPHHPFLLSQLAEEKYYVEKDTQQAEKILSGLQQQDPFRLEHTPLYSNLLFLKPDPVGLCNLAQKVYRTDPYRSEANIVVGNYYSCIHEYERSIFHFRRALMADPTVATAWTLLGQGYLENKNLQAALNAFRSAVEIDPRDYRGWYNLGHSYELLSVFHRARYYYSKAAQLRPWDSRMWRAMASCFRKEGKERMALECLERAEACEAPPYVQEALARSTRLWFSTEGWDPSRYSPSRVAITEEDKDVDEEREKGKERELRMADRRVSPERTGPLLHGGSLSSTEIILTSNEYSHKMEIPVERIPILPSSPFVVPYTYAVYSPRTASEVVASLFSSPPPGPAREYIGILEDLAEYYVSNGKSIVSSHGQLDKAYRFLRRGMLYYYKLFIVLGGIQSRYVEPIALYMVEGLLYCAEVLLYLKYTGWTWAAHALEPDPPSPVSSSAVHYPPGTQSHKWGGGVGSGGSGSGVSYSAQGTHPMHAFPALTPVDGGPLAQRSATPPPSGHTAGQAMKSTTAVLTSVVTSAIPPPSRSLAFANFLSQLTFEQLKDVAFLLNGAEEWLRCILIADAFRDLPPLMHPSAKGPTRNVEEPPEEGEGGEGLAAPSPLPFQSSPSPASAPPSYTPPPLQHSIHGKRSGSKGNAYTTPSTPPSNAMPSTAVYPVPFSPAFRAGGTTPSSASPFGTPPRQAWDPSSPYYSASFFLPFPPPPPSSALKEETCWYTTLLARMEKLQSLFRLAESECS